jgi:hypothetical protein
MLGGGTEELVVKPEVVIAYNMGMGAFTERINSWLPSLQIRL